MKISLIFIKIDIGSVPLSITQNLIKTHDFSEIFVLTTHIFQKATKDYYPKWLRMRRLNSFAVLSCYSVC